MNILKLELKNCFKRKEFHFIFCFMLIVSVVAFAIECIALYGSDMRFVRSASESTLIQGTYANTVRFTLVLMLPLVCSLVYADSFYTDFKNGVYKIIITRTTKKKYVVVKAIAIFISTFSVFFITLFVNQLLSLITFPQTGFDNIYSLPPYDIGIQNYNNIYFLDFMRIQSPFLYNTFFVIIISIFAGLISVLTYSIYFMFLSKNRIVGIMFIFICYILANIAFPILGFPNLSLYEQMNPTHIGNLSELIIWMLILLIFSIYFIINDSSPLFVK